MWFVCWREQSEAPTCTFINGKLIHDGRQALFIFSLSLHLNVKWTKISSPIRSNFSFQCSIPNQRGISISLLYLLWVVRTMTNFSLRYVIRGISNVKPFNLLRAPVLIGSTVVYLVSLSETSGFRDTFIDNKVQWRTIFLPHRLDSFPVQNRQ